MKPISPVARCALLVVVLATLAHAEARGQAPAKAPVKTPAPAAAQAKDRVLVGAAANTRKSCAAFLYSSTAASFEVFGQFELTYGSPTWKDEYGEAIENAAPGTRLRIGNNFFATFDTSCPVRIGEQDLQPGLYYLALECGKAGAMSLLFLDPVPIREARQNASDAAAVRGGVKAELKVRKDAEPAPELSITWRRIGDSGTKLTPVLRFGDYEMTTVLEATVAAKDKPVQVGAANNERAGRSVFFYSRGADSLKVHGQFELTYGSPTWKEEYGKAVANANAGDRLRIGNNFFATFDTSCPVDLGGAKLQPGCYYLALESRGPEKMALVFLDPAGVRAKKWNANQTAETSGGVRMDLVWGKESAIADRLTIDLRPSTGADKVAADLTLRFGPFRMSGTLRPVIGTVKKP